MPGKFVLITWENNDGFPFSKKGIDFSSELINERSNFAR